MKARGIAAAHRARARRARCKRDGLCQHCRGGRERVARAAMRLHSLAPRRLLLAAAGARRHRHQPSRRRRAIAATARHGQRRRPARGRGRRGDAAPGRKRGRRGVRDPARAQRRRAAKLGHRRRRLSASIRRTAAPRGRPSTDARPRRTRRRGTWFYKDGQPMSHEEAIPGGKSVGVPGNLRMMALAHQRYGKLPWAALFQPAIRLARDGFRITPRLYGSLSRHRRHRRLSAEGARTVLRQPTAIRCRSGPGQESGVRAASSKSIAARGAGQLLRRLERAQAIVATVNGAPRNPSQHDASATSATYNAKAAGAGLRHLSRLSRSAGWARRLRAASTVFEILKQLERFDLAALGPNSPAAWHLIAESMRLAYADRDQYRRRSGVRVGARRRPDGPGLSGAALGADLARSDAWPASSPGRRAGAPKVSCVAAPVAGARHLAFRRRRLRTAMSRRRPRRSRACSARA